MMDVRRAVGRTVTALLLAGAPAVPARAQTGALAGTVYDSLAHTMLAGATVLIRGTSRIGFTDAAGHFRIDSVPAGTWIVTFEHPALDSAGVPANVVRVGVQPGTTTEITLATRSAATLRRGACRGASLGPLGDSAVVFGTARDAESGVRLSGALVTVEWTTVSRAPDGRIIVDRPSVRTSSDSTGTYYACGVPSDIVLDETLRADSFTSGAVEVLVGPRQFFRRDLAVSREPIATAAAPVGPASTSAVVTLRPVGGPTVSTSRGYAVLAGQVLDDHNTPRAGARIVVDDAGRETRTDQAGNFVLGGLPSGSHMAMARLIGFTASRLPVDLRNRDTTIVTFRIRSVTVLDTLRVTASGRLAHELEDMAARQRAAAGTLIGEQELKRRQSMRSAIEGVSGIEIVGTRGVTNDYQIYLRGQGAQLYCVPTVYIDGIKASTEELAAYQPPSLVALEIYPQPTASLGRYSSDDRCGVILAWTRAYR